MKRSVLLQSILCISLLAARAAAADPAPLPERHGPPTVPATVAEGPAVDNADVRLRFDVLGSFSGAFAVRGPDFAAGGGPFGVTLDVGVQLGDHVAIYGRAEGSTFLFTNHAALYGIAEWTPENHFSIGTGLGWDGCALVVPMSGGVAWSGVSVPLVLSWGIGRIDPSVARRKLVRISVETALGLDPSSGAVGTHLAIGIGRAWM